MQSIVLMHQGSLEVRAGAAQWLDMKANERQPEAGLTKKKNGAIPPGVTALYRAVRAVLDQARTCAYRTVNIAMVRAYWQVGWLIVEHEQGGQERATYGEAVLEELSRRLMAEFGRGFDVTNLRKMR